MVSQNTINAKERHLLKLFHPYRLIDKESPRTWMCGSMPATFLVSYRMFQKVLPFVPHAQRVFGKWLTIFGTVQMVGCRILKRLIEAARKSSCARTLRQRRKNFALNFQHYFSKRLSVNCNIMSPFQMAESNCQSKTYFWQNSNT